MRTKKEINNRIDSLYDSLSNLEELLGDSYDMEESLGLTTDVAIIESKINSLKWVLNTK